MKALDVTARFSIERIALLLRNRLLEDLPGFAIGFAILLGLNALTLLLGKTAFMNERSGGIWTVFVVSSGILLSSFAFKGMHSGRSGPDWLLLPATPLEKYGAALLAYVLIFPLAASAVSTGLSALLYLVERALGGSGGVIWTPLLSGGFETWGAYAVMSLVFLAGSATFRKRAPLKTFGVLTGYGLVMAFILIGGVFLIYRSRGLLTTEFDFRNGVFNIEGAEGLAALDGERVGGIYETAMNILFYGILPLFSLGFGYLKVAEKEARDEVQ
ncbi:MAG: hypothetical protein JNG85_15170 [Spirochaetaceae bacterium]|nr:hypothetical protein [Spirochaetaceae bacterium]